MSIFSETIGQMCVDSRKKKIKEADKLKPITVNETASQIISSGNSVHDEQNKNISTDTQNEDS